MSYLVKFNINLTNSYWSDFIAFTILACAGFTAVLAIF